jgi:hypothetical protein
VDAQQLHELPRTDRPVWNPNNASMAAELSAMPRPVGKIESVATRHESSVSSTTNSGRRTAAKPRTSIGRVNTMSDPTQLTRRDWFRLRSRKESVATDNRPEKHSMGQSQESLQPIANPDNHDGLDLSELPPMREAMLSAEQIRQLFTDIEELADNILLMQRTAQSPRAAVAHSTSSVNLVAARDAILTGQVPRLQIRYRWQNADWIDTLETRESEYRLVRITHRNVR